MNRRTFIKLLGSGLITTGIIKAPCAEGFNLERHSIGKEFRTKEEIPYNESFLYPKCYCKIVNREIDWVRDDIKVFLINNDYYSVNPGRDEFASDIPSRAKVAVASIENRVLNGKSCESKKPTFFENVPQNQRIHSLVIFKNAWTDYNSPLVAYIGRGFRMPLVSDGGDICIEWDDFIFKLPIYV